MPIDPNAYKGWVPSQSGTMQPTKYPSVGKNYNTFGEVPGYTYNYLNDTYIPQKGAIDAVKQQAGYGEEKPPGLLEQLAPVGAAGLAFGAAKGFSDNPSGFIGGIKDGVSGVFGLGGSAPAAATTPVEAATAPSIGAQIAGSSAAAPAAPNIVGASVTGAETPGMFSLGGVGSAGNAILPAAGAFGVYDLATNDRGPVGGAVEGAASGAAIGSFFGPPGAAIGAGIGGVAGLAKGFFEHKSTKQYEKERWGGLEDKGVANASTAYQANHPQGDSGVWQTGQFAGKKWNFADALTLAKQDPTHFQHVYGNYDTFGSDWSSYSDAQQKAIVSKLANEGLYKGDHGDVVITNEDRARQIKDEILSGKAAPKPQAQAPQVAPQVAPQPAPTPQIAPGPNRSMDNPKSIAQAAVPPKITNFGVRR